MAQVHQSITTRGPGDLSKMYTHADTWKVSVNSPMRMAGSGKARFDFGRLTQFTFQEAECTCLSVSYKQLPGRFLAQLRNSYLGWRKVRANAPN
jgi:hypothetical protein